jgi:hypothetical protein
MDRSGHRRLILLTLVTAVAVTQPASAEGTAVPTVRVDVAIDRGMFQDGLYRGAYSIECPEEIEPGDCPAPQATSDVDPVHRTIRMARLGFDITRRVEAGAADLPSAETLWAAAPQQLTRLLFTIHSAGDYVVTVSGEPSDEVDPRPVSGSASAGGVIEDHSVSWRFEDSQPGQHEMTVRFAPNAAPGWLGTFAPRVVVEGVIQSDRLLESAYSFVPTDPQPSAMRISTLTLRQRVASDFGYPFLRSDRFHPAVGTDSLPTSWDTSVSLDAIGNYQPELGDVGTISTSSKVLFSNLVPQGSSANLFGMGAVYHQLLGQNKAEVIPGWVLFDETPMGFKLTMQTTKRSEEGSPLDGTLWDGDAMVAAAAGTAGTVLAEDRGPPVDDDGAIRGAGNGAMAQGWAALWANSAPAGEPNAFNTDRHILDAYNGVFPQFARPYGRAFLAGAAIPVVADGGDIDNRTGSTHRVGEPIVLELPPGQKVYSSIVFHASILESKYEPELTMAGRHLTITPRVAPGGYWRRSSGGGFERDWANLELVTLSSTPDDGGEPPEIASTALVPKGLAGSVDVFVRGLGWRSLSLAEGAWRVVASAEGVSVREVDLAAAVE